MSQDQGLIVRRSARHDVAMHARVAIAQEHASIVRLSAASGARDGWLDADVVDFSAGGVGFMTGVWLPRRCILRLQIIGPDDPKHVLLDTMTRVMRVTMTDRRPAYLIGTAFVQPMTSDAQAQMSEILARLGDPSVADQAPARAGATHA